MILQRLVLDFRSDEIAARVLYRRSLQAAPNPGTKARRREVTELARTGLTQALKALDSEAGVECVGTSGFTTSPRQPTRWPVFGASPMRTASGPARSPSNRPGRTWPRSRPRMRTASAPARRPPWRPPPERRSSALPFLARSGAGVRE